MVTSPNRSQRAPALAPDALALNELLLDTWWRVSRYLNAEFEGARAVDNLTIGQLKILQALIDGPLIMTTVARAAGVTRGAATGMVDRMVARGLVHRFEDPSNRRVVMVRMTPEGERLKAEVHHRTVLRAHSLTNGLTGEQRRHLTELLGALGAAVQRNGGIAAR